MVQAARRAFKGLAYKRYQHVPLYLEWAPKEIFGTDDDDEAAAAPAAKTRPQKVAAAAANLSSDRAPTPDAKATAVLSGLVDAEAADTDGVTLFVKNISFGTSEPSFPSQAASAYAQIMILLVLDRKSVV